MSCVSCGHNDWVTIGQKQYCAHCGDPAGNATATTKSVQASSNTSQAATPKPLAAATPTTTAAPKAMSDLKPKGSLNPAASYHARSTSAPTATLNLRPDMPAKPAAVAHTDTVRRLDMRAPKPSATAPAATPAPTQPAERIARVNAIPKSPSISRFRSTKPLADQTKPAAALDTVPSQTKQSEAVQFAPAASITQDIEQVVNELPNQVVSQLKAMQNLIPPTAPATKTKEPKTNKTPKAVSIAAAGMAAAVMAGYIWLNNYDSLSIKAAAQKAGIAATAPSYLPASYNLAGPISFGTGFVNMQYKSPSSSQLISINQRKSDWTPASLLELYVNKNSKTYLSVQTQGLTIYLLDNNQVTWVNRGIQYVLQGNTMLNQDQLVKIAESL